MRRFVPRAGAGAAAADGSAFRPGGALPRPPPGFPQDAPRHGLWTVLAALYAGLIFALSATPGRELGSLGLPAWLFNMSHVPLYGGLASLVAMAFGGSLRGLRRGPWPTLWTLGAVGTYAIGDEIHQRFVPDRAATVEDVGLDLLGAAIALGLIHLLARRRASAGKEGGTGRAGRVAPELLLLLGAFALAFLVYLPSLGNDFTHWDDETYVTANPRIRGITPGNVRSWWAAPFFGNYAPLTLASYALDHVLWGLNPFGYHLGNVLLHAFSAGLFGTLLLRLGAPRVAGFLAAALFAFHPAQVEAVAWIAQRKTVLSMVFLLLSFHAYVGATRRVPVSWAGLLASLALFVAALLSKVSGVIFPGILVLYDLGYRRVSLARMLLEKAPFLLAALLLGAVGYQAQVDLGVTREGWLGGTPALHGATMAGFLARYGRILLFPTGLSALYDPPDARSLTEPWVLVGAGLLALGALGWVWAFARRRRALAWMGFFWLGLVPVSQIIPFWVHLADRYLYLPSLGVAAGAGALGSAWLGSLRSSGRRLLGSVAVGLVLIAFATLTVARQRVWQNSLTLWGDTIRRPPVHAKAYFFYGRNLHLRGDPQGALPYYERSHALEPDVYITLLRFGLACAEVGEMGRAEALLRSALARPNIPPESRAPAAFNLALVLAARGRHEEAISAYHEALGMAPDHAPIYASLARSLRWLGRPREARLRIAQALELEPGNAEAEIVLAGLDADAGRRAEARRRLEAVIERKLLLPEALFERSRIAAAEGDFAAARADLDRAEAEARGGFLVRQIREAREALDRGEIPPVISGR